MSQTIGANSQSFAIQPNASQVDFQKNGRDSEEENEKYKSIPTGEKKPPNVDNSFVGDESEVDDIESKAMNIKFPAIESKKHGIISTTM